MSEKEFIYLLLAAIGALWIYAQKCQSDKDDVTRKYIELSDLFRKVMSGEHEDDDGHPPKPPE